MKVWKMINIRWSREEIASWKSLRKAVYIILPLLVYFLVHDAFQVLLWAFLNQFLLICREETTRFLTANAYTVQGVINGLAILLGVASIWQAVRNETVWKSQIGREVKKPETPKAVEAGNGIERKTTGYIVLGVLAFLSALGLNTLFHLLGITESSKAFQDTANAQFGVVFLVGLVLYGVLSPFAEEAVFRGLIYNRMKRCFNYPIALVVSSLLFGCYHGNAVQAAYGTLLGLLIAYTYEKYKSFAAPVLFHAVANISIFTLTYYNALGGMGRRAGWRVTIVSLAGAGSCLWRIRNYASGNMKKMRG